MKLKMFLATAIATLFNLIQGVAMAGGSIEESGVIVCVNDKWEEKETDKGHKLVDYAGRCVKVPDNAAAAKVTEDCAGQYEYTPDGSWSGSGTCIAKYSADDTISLTWAESSKLEEWVYKATGGTGKYKGIGGGGTYKYDNLSDTLAGGRYKSRWELP
jgi:hypothetical protein